MGKLSATGPEKSYQGSEDSAREVYKGKAEGHNAFHTAEHLGRDSTGTLAFMWPQALRRVAHGGRLARRASLRG